MKIAKIVAAGLFLALPTAAQAQWYVGADAGVNFLQDSDIKSKDGSSDKSTAGNDTGYALQAHGGYAFKPFSFATPRVEAEIGYRNSGLENLTDVTDASGDTSSLSLMANGVLSFLPNRAWHPFVGAGIGMSRISAEWKVNGNKVVDDSDWVFAYQAFAGVSYDLTKNWELSAQYRYFGTQDPEFSDNSGGKAKGEYSSHAILAGFAYKFAK